MKPLDFKDDKTSSLPKPVTFPTVQCTAVYGIKPLTFSTPPIESKPVPQVKSVFEEKKNPLLEECLKRIQNIENQSKIERQIKQLINLDTDQIMNWGSSVLDDAVELTQTIIRVSQQVTQLNVVEYIDQVVKMVDDKRTVFERLKNTPVDTIKIVSKLNSLKIDLQKYMETKILDEKFNECEERLFNFTQSLKVVEEAAKHLGSYDTVEDIMYNRRILLSQAIQQLQLSKLQVQQTQTMIRTQRQKIDQIIYVMIPAFQATQQLKVK